ncbi:MAG: hypothetical protein DWI57_06900 [Chloroflexi bacterium]|nr:MAG: hypothetical protein DWI57_06900 [Chloroflexota bacterium]
MESSSTPDEELAEREDWLALSAAGLAEAYGDDEPVYTLAHIKEWNPEYAGDNLSFTKSVYTEEEIDERVIAEAEDDTAWGDPVFVHRQETFD